MNSQITKAKDKELDKLLYEEFKRRLSDRKAAIVQMAKIKYTDDVEKAENEMYKYFKDNPYN